MYHRFPCRCFGPENSQFTGTVKKRPELCNLLLSKASNSEVMQTIGGATPLMYACQQCREKEVSDILIKQPYSVKERDRTLKTPLHYCAENPNTSCAEAVLKIAPELVNAQDENGYCTLHLAVIAGNKSLIKLLIAKGADVNVYDNEGHSAVHWAIVSSEKEALEMIIGAGANPSTPDIHGGYPLHYAVQMCGAHSEYVRNSEDTVRVVEALLNFGVDVSVKDKDGRQPILWAASAGSADAVIHLVSGGACVEAADKDGLTALHCAASRGHTSTLETLITLCGANVDVIDGNGCSALFYSVTLGHADATELLLSLGAEPNRQDRKGRTPAHCGAAKGQLETLRILQKHGGNLWLRNVKGDIPLHEAVASGRKDLVLWLLSQNSEAINLSNNDGRSPLHIASMYNNTEMVKVLLDAKSLVNPVMRTSKGVLMTPLNVALCKGHRSCGKYLQLHGGVPFSKVSNTEPFTVYAVRISPSDEMMDKTADASMENLTPSPGRTSKDKTSTDVQVIETDTVDKKKVYRRRKKKKSSSNIDTKDSDSDNSVNDIMIKTRINRRNSKSNENNDNHEEGHEDEKILEIKKVQSVTITREKGSSEKVTKPTNRALARKGGREPQSGKKEETVEENVVVKKMAKTKTEPKPLPRNKSLNEHKNVNDISPEDFPPLMQTINQLVTVTLEPEIDLGKPQSENEVNENFLNSRTPDFESSNLSDAEHLLESIQTEKKEEGVMNPETTIAPENDLPTASNVQEVNKLSETNFEIEEKNKNGNVEGVADESPKNEDVVQKDEKDAKRDEKDAKKNEKDVKKDEKDAKKDEKDAKKDEKDAKKDEKDAKKDEKDVKKDEKDANKDGKSKITGGIRREERSVKSPGSKTSNEEDSTGKSENPLKSPASKSSSDGPSAKKEEKISKSRSKNSVNGVSEGGDKIKKTTSPKGHKSGSRSEEKPSSPDKDEDQKDKDTESEVKETSPEEPEKPKSLEEIQVPKTDEKSPEATISSNSVVLGEKPETNTAIDKVPSEEIIKSEEVVETTSIVGASEKEVEVPVKVEEKNDLNNIKEMVNSSSAIEEQTSNVFENDVISIKEVEVPTKTPDSGNPKPVSAKRREIPSEVAEASQVTGLPQNETSKTKDSSPDDTISQEDEAASKILPSALKNTAAEKKNQTEAVDAIQARTSLSLATSSDLQNDPVVTDPNKSEDISVTHNETTAAETTSANEGADIQPSPKEVSFSKEADTADGGVNAGENPQNEINSGFTSEQRHHRAPRVSRLCRRHGDVKEDFNQISANQLVQNTIRKYHMERGIFYQLLELKRLQIRAGRANEQVLVKRLADEYERSRAFMGMKHFSGLYKFKEFEKFLYDQLKSLNSRRSYIIPEIKSYDDIDALSGFLKKSRFKIISDAPQSEAYCTCITQRCHHSACAYTSVPCSAYITNVRRHKPHRPKRECFFPRIEQTTTFKTKKEKLDDRPATLELIQGNEKHVITLPQNYPDKGKRYYITFTIKGAPFKEEGFFDDSKDFFKHRHAKSV